MQPNPPMRDAPFTATLRLFIETPRFQNTIMSLIIINAVLLGFETSPAIMAEYGFWIVKIDTLILAIFTLEIAARLVAYRSHFWRDPWSIFDFVVVVIALLPSTGQFSVLRALRVLRVMRLLTIVPSMRRVVGALLSAIPGLISIVLVLSVIYYVFAVVATNLFADQFPDWFGHLGRSLYTLFQVMTLESWSMGIARPVMEAYPYAWLFFVPFILVTTFTMLNLFIAIIVNAMQNFNEAESFDLAEKTTIATHQAQEHIEAEMHHEFVRLQQELRQELADIKRALVAINTHDKR